MLWPYLLKAFVEKFNEFNVDDDGITPTGRFSGTTTDVTLKITTDVAVQFIYWVKDYKAAYMDYQSGNPYHIQGSISVTNPLIQCMTIIIGDIHYFP